MSFATNGLDLIRMTIRASTYSAMSTAGTREPRHRPVGAEVGTDLGVVVVVASEGIRGVLSRYVDGSGTNARYPPKNTETVARKPKISTAVAI